MFARSFADEEEDSPQERESTGEEEPQYTFEGFDIEFSQKVMLTPVAVGRGALGKG